MRDRLGDAGLVHRHDSRDVAVHDPAARQEEGGLVGAVLGIRPERQVVADPLADVRPVAIVLGDGSTSGR